MKVIIVLMVILCLASPVMAQGMYHEFTLELEGEWEFDQNIVMPKQSSQISLSGVGKAQMHSVLKESPTWWDLF